MAALHELVPFNGPAGARCLSSVHDEEAGSDEDSRYIAVSPGPTRRAEALRTLTFVAIAGCSVAAVFRAVTYGDAVHGADRSAGAASDAVALAAAPIAPRRPPWECAADGQDCSSTKCCATPGSSCFKKNAYWMMCNQTCTPGHHAGDKDNSSWSCEAVTPPARPSCSWEGDNCHESQCCRRVGFKCFEKYSKVGYCGKTCESAIGDDPEPWTCRELGGDVGLHVVQKSEHPAFTSLFCWTVVTPDGVTAEGVSQGYESSLLDLMKTKKLGIFQCDATSVFEGVRVQKGDWKSMANTDVFLRAWQQVKKTGYHYHHDWTVKADADAVFFPNRLRAHLRSLSPPAHEAVYLHNINFKFHFMGALEVLSSKAVDALLESFDKCSRSFGLKGGEDLFTMQCLDAAYVGHMTDFSLLDDKYRHSEGWHLFDVSPCADPTIVAYHPYKHVNSWEGCYKVAMGINRPSDFVGCTKRWHGDACSLKSSRAHLPTDPKDTRGIVVNLRK